MDTPNYPLIQEHLADAAASGKLGGLEIECWKGGGLPPPYYRSDQLRLLTLDRVDSIVFNHLTFDQGLKPPEVLERWTVPLRPDELRAVVHLLREHRLAEADYKGEVPKSAPDQLSTEIVLTVGPNPLTRTFGKDLPAELSELEGRFQKLIAYAKENGRKARVHNDKEID